MGAWGAALFDDDDAADVRQDYPVWLADAQSSEGATELAVRNFGADWNQLQDTTAFWLALASVQWKAGRLDQRVLQAALRIIDDGIDIAKWADSPLRAKRASTLKKLRAQITAPCPPARPLPKALPVQLPGWEFGEVVAYRTQSGRYAVLHVLSYHAWTSLKVKAPAVTVLSWFGTELPDESAVQGLTYINHNGWIGGHHLLSLAMPRSRALRDDQFHHLGCKKPVTREEATSAIYDIGGGGDGLTLDIALKKVLGPYWQDPTRPVHLPKMLPADPAESERLMSQLRERMFGSAQKRE